MFRTTLFMLVTAAFLLLAGCGGTPRPISNTSRTPPATPPSSGSGGTGAGGNTSGGGGGSGGSGAGTTINSTEFQASLVGQQDRTVHGSVTVDADGASGNATFQFSGEPANTSFSVRTCDTPADPNCPELTVGVTDATGSASGTFHIDDVPLGPPYQNGEFVVEINGSYVLLAAWSVADSTSMYSTPLYQVWNDGTQTTPVDPLTSGRAEAQGNKLHITLSGAAPNATYSVFMSLQLGTVGAATAIGSVTTDASGNLDTTLTIPASGFGIVLARGDTTEFEWGIRTRP